MSRARAALSTQGFFAMASSSSNTVFLCGDVMCGRGIDQILPNPSMPELHEPYADSALDYWRLAQQCHGPVPRRVNYGYIWGDALAELREEHAAVRIANLETAITTSNDWLPKGINYRMHPANAECLRAAGIQCCNSRAAAS